MNATPPATVMKVIDLVDKDKAVVGETTVPSIRDATDVLIQVSYSALDTAFPEVAERSFVASFLHDLKGKPLVPGWHYSGMVSAVGDAVTDLQAGDHVFGHLPYDGQTKQGTCAAWVVVPRTECALLPKAGVSLETAAAATVEASTALQGMRDEGQMKVNDRILVIAAAGGVGSMAIQIAKHGLQASIVHGVCSTKDMEKIARLGADKVIDRKTTDITKDLEPGMYDVILELTGMYTFGALKYALKARGTIVTTVPNLTTMLFSWIVPFLYGGRRYRSFIVQSKQADLELIADWLKEKIIHSVPIDSVTNVSDFAAARERLNDSKKGGRVVIKVAGGW